MKRFSALAALCALLVVAGCQTVVKTTTTYKDGRREVRESTPANERALLQARALGELVELAKGGHFGRRVEVRPIDPTKPVNAVATVTDTDPAIVRRLISLGNYSGYRDPTNGWDTLKGFFDRLFGFGEKVAEKSMWAYGVGQAADVLKEGYKAAGSRTTFTGSFNNTGDQAPTTYSGGAYSPPSVSVTGPRDTKDSHDAGGEQ